MWSLACLTFMLLLLPLIPFFILTYIIFPNFVMNMAYLLDTMTVFLSDPFFKLFAPSSSSKGAMSGSVFSLFISANLPVGVFSLPCQVSCLSDVSSILTVFAHVLYDGVNTVHHVSKPSSQDWWWMHHRHKETGATKKKKKALTLLTGPWGK